MKRFSLAFLAAAALAALYLDSVFFPKVNLGGIRPDALLALVAAMSLLMGSTKGAVLGLALGLIADVLYARMVGLTAIGCMVCGAAGGFFYQKYYADNLVFPALIAAAGALFKEHVMALAARLSGADFSYFHVLGSYILPCMLMTVALSIPVHALMKRLYAGQIRTEKRAMRDRAETGGAS